MGKLVIIVSGDFHFVIPNKLPSAIKNSDEFLHIHMFLFRFVQFNTFSIESLACVNKHVATLLIGNRIIIIKLYQA